MSAHVSAQRPLGVAAVVANGRRLWLVGACLAACLGQGSVSAQGASRFRLERAEEDWSAVAADAPFGAQFKDLPVADGTAVSLGGDARWRLTMLDAPRLGLGGATSDSWFLQRLMLHGDVRHRGVARLFVQFGAHASHGRAIPSPSDDDAIDLHQAFAEISADVAGGRATLRLGRQELALGPRFVTARDSSNVRQRHDLARLSYVRGPWRADLFAGRPVTVEPGAFDDRRDSGQRFRGMLLTRRIGAIALEGYVYDLDRERAALGAITARDNRRSYGLRAAGQQGVFDFDVELMLQRGRFGAQDIRASGLVVDVGRRWPDAPLAPRLGGRLTFGGGDADPGDRVQGTFAPPFPNTSWFGPSGVASYSNLTEAGATLSLAPRPGLNLNFKLGPLWRSSAADFLYAGSAAVAGTEGGSSFVGTSGNLLVLWFASRNLVFAPGASFLRVAEGLRARGARNLALGQFIVNFQF